MANHLPGSGFSIFFGSRSRVGRKFQAGFLREINGLVEIVLWSPVFHDLMSFNECREPAAQALNRTLLGPKRP